MDYNNKVRLKVTFRKKDGSVYFPGIYGPGELPKEAYTERYSEVIETRPLSVNLDVGKIQKPEVEKAKPVIEEQRIEIYKNKNSQDVEYRPKESKVKIETLGGVTVEEVEKVEEVEEVEKAEKVEKSLGLNVNTASREELIELKGVGESTASKVIEQRDEKPFVSFADLNERVDLAKGKDWESFNITF